ncbi:MAG: hypothetical protein OXH86_07875 [Acidimicrobiaceae bacterium]|nr:hypothetical protein [Acidimicrobiaceae bacterium]
MSVDLPDELHHGGTLLLTWNPDDWELTVEEYYARVLITATIGGFMSGWTLGTNYRQMGAGCIQPRQARTAPGEAGIELRVGGVLPVGRALRETARAGRARGVPGSCRAGLAERRPCRQQMARPGLPRS